MSSPVGTARTAAAGRVEAGPASVRSICSTTPHNTSRSSATSASGLTAANPSIMSATTLDQGRSRSTSDTVAPPLACRRILRLLPWMRGGLRNVGAARPRARAASPSARAVAANRSDRASATTPIMATGCDSLDPQSGLRSARGPLQEPEGFPSARGAPGEFSPEPVSEAILDATVARVADAVGRIVAVRLGGAEVTTQPGNHRRWCSELGTCEPGPADVALDEELSDNYRPPAGSAEAMGRAARPALPTGRRSAILGRWTTSSPK